MILIEQLVTLDKNNLTDITFEGQSIYNLQDVIQEIGLYNENIVYETEMYASFSIKLKGLDSYEKQKLEETDVNNVLYEEVLTLDLEYADGFIIHINKSV